MYKGLRHTAACSKCGETRKSFVTYAEMDNFSRNNKSDCCNTSFEYIGLQPYNETITKSPIITVGSVSEHIEMIEDKVEPEIKEIKVEIQKEPEIQPQSEPQMEIQPEPDDEVKPEPKSENVTIKIIASNTTLKITDLLDTTLKINNNHMIPVLKEAMEEQNHAKINLLKTHYPAVFDKSLKYIPKKLRKQTGYLNE